MKIGRKAPAFTLQDKDGNKVSLNRIEADYTIVYFYPKDNTPGCTTEACEFTEALPGFNDLDAIILGVSADPIASHEKFKNKFQIAGNWC